MTTSAVRPSALVTGASRGLGEVVAGYLAGAGYDLVLTARGTDALERSAARLRPLGGSVSLISGDVAEESVRTALRDAVGKLGHLDVLINNASELGPSGRPSLLGVPPSEFDHVLRVNVVAPVALLAAVLPALRASSAPLVVNVSSDAALGAYPGWGAYGASKAALDLVTRTLAAELAAEHISVVSVDPGDLRTTMHQDAFQGEDISDRPLPEVTVPFWAWLFGQDPRQVNGQRFRAQAERWGTPE